MHYLYLVFSPLKTIEEVDIDLLNNDFISDGWYSKSKGDWYQMGGRWSGILSDGLTDGLTEENSNHMKLSEELFNKIKNEYPDCECMIYDGESMDREEELRYIKYKSIKDLYCSVVDLHN